MSQVAEAGGKPALQSLGPHPHPTAQGLGGALLDCHVHLHRARLADGRLHTPRPAVDQPAPGRLPLDDWSACGAREGGPRLGSGPLGALTYRPAPQVLTPGLCLAVNPNQNRVSTVGRMHTVNGTGALTGDVASPPPWRAGAGWRWRERACRCGMTAGVSRVLFSLGECLGPIVCVNALYAIGGEGARPLPSLARGAWRVSTAPLACGHANRGGPEERPDRDLSALRAQRGDARTHPLRLRCAKDLAAHGPTSAHPVPASIDGERVECSTKGWQRGVLIQYTLAHARFTQQAKRGRQQKELSHRHRGRKGEGFSRLVRWPCRPRTGPRDA